jgi:hypothetical protein
LRTWKLSTIWIVSWIKSNPFIHFSDDFGAPYSPGKQDQREGGSVNGALHWFLVHKQQPGLYKWLFILHKASWQHIGYLIRIYLQFMTWICRTICGISTMPGRRVDRSHFAGVCSFCVWSIHGNLWWNGVGPAKWIVFNPINVWRMKFERKLLPGKRIRLHGKNMGIVWQTSSSKVQCYFWMGTFIEFFSEHPLAKDHTLIHNANTLIHGKAV